MIIALYEAMIGLAADVENRSSRPAAEASSLTDEEKIQNDADYEEFMDLDELSVLEDLVAQYRDRAFLVRLDAGPCIRITRVAGTCWLLCSVLNKHEAVL